MLLHFLHLVLERFVEIKLRRIEQGSCIFNEMIHNLC